MSTRSSASGAGRPPRGCNSSSRAVRRRLDEGGERAEEPGELGRDHELGGTTVTDAGQGGQVLHRERGLVGFCGLDAQESHAGGLPFALAELLQTGLVGLGPQVDRLGVAFGVEDRRLPATFGGEDR